MSKREVEEEDSLITAIAVKEAKLETQRAEQEGREQEFLAMALKTMKKDMRMTDEEVEGLIDQYEEELIEKNSSVENISMDVELTNFTKEIDSEPCGKQIAACIRMGFDVEGALYEERDKIVHGIRETIVAAWNKRHPRLPALLSKSPNPYSEQGKKVWMIIRKSE